MIHVNVYVLEMVIGGRDEEPAAIAVYGSLAEAKESVTAEDVAWIDDPEWEEVTEDDFRFWRLGNFLISEWKGVQVDE